VSGRDEAELPYVVDGPVALPYVVDDEVPYVVEGDDVLAPAEVLLFIVVPGVPAPAAAWASAPVADELPGCCRRQSLSATPCKFAHGAYDMRDGDSGVVVALGVVWVVWAPAAPAANAVARSRMRGLKIDWFM